VRWHSLKNFISDVGDKPSSKHQLDRIDNNADYGPGNTRLVTHKVNVMNRSVTIKLMYKGKLQTIEEVSADLGIATESLRSRLKAKGDPFRPKAKRFQNMPRPSPALPQQGEGEKP
jgi:hypothetical protein